MRLETNSTTKSKTTKSYSLSSLFKIRVEDRKLSGYLISNAISSGSFLLLFIGLFLNHILEQPFMTVRPSAIYTGTIISLTFLFITALLLVRDIEDYRVFFRNLIRPKKNSTFVMGAYAITLYGVLMTLFAISIWNKWKSTSTVLIYFTAISALTVSLYTAYLLNQNKKHWNGFALSMHTLTHSFMAGGAAYSIADAFFRIGSTWGYYVDIVLHIAIISNFLVNILELILIRKMRSHRHLVHGIIYGEFKWPFWIGNVLIGNLIPFILIFFSDLPVLQTLAGVGILIGIFILDRIWITAPTYLLSKNQTLINNEAL